ncbi:Ubiquitin-like-specific protease 1D [Abeliophyllum distichum]|uniref:Ubiquitin-like-specific protease 1D n=1 Tax=Abeliophyllum distichum TaxID=126358 RepID=A0ABD1U429_9LAMI
MEGGGGRKRKSPLALDWEKLLGKEDDEDPVLVVKRPAAAEKPTTDGGEESSREDHFRQLSDKELIVEIGRMKSNLRTLAANLPDRGEKFLASIKRREDELERRKHQEDDGRFKKSTQSIDDPTCVGASDGSKPGALSSVPTSQSHFASCFSSKLDDKTAHRVTNAFEKEISALYRCDSKNVRGNGQLPSQGIDKSGVSSRQMPFKSPNHLLGNADKQLQSNDEQRGRHSSTPSPSSEEDLPGCFSKKRKSSGVQALHDQTQNNGKTVVLLDEDPEVSEVIAQADKVDERMKETRIYYPSRDDPEAVEIGYSDMECLAPESYLSSTIMNFYIRYLQKSISPTYTERHYYHFFNTYFYKKLKQDVLTKNDKETSFVKFRRWWKGVNIFEKAYIFLPVHEDHHWSLVIICIPKKEDEYGPILLHLDSLRLHASKSIFENIRSFLIEELKFLRREVPPDLRITDKIWQLWRRIDEKIIEVPQQKNEYDCGLFVLFFMERFIKEAPQRLKKKDLSMFGKQWFRPENASDLRRKIRNILEKEFRNASEVRVQECKIDGAFAVLGRYGSALLISQVLDSSLACYDLCCLNKQRQPRGWSSWIIPPPLETSIASNICTTSSILGRLLGSVPQHFFITSATDLGQQFGISGLGALNAELKELAKINL